MKVPGSRGWVHPCPGANPRTSRDRKSVPTNPLTPTLLPSTLDFASELLTGPKVMHLRLGFSE